MWDCEPCLAVGRRVTATRVLPIGTALCTAHASPYVERFFNEVGGDVMTREIDLPAVESDLAAGASLKEAARKHEVPESTLRGRLRKSHANGSGAARTPNAVAHDQDLEALAQFLDAEWKRLSLLQRVRCLLTLN
jgi:hypothetical protein